MSGAIVAMGGGGFSEEPDNPLLDRFALPLARREPLAPLHDGLHLDAAGSLVEAVASRQAARAYRIERGAVGAAVERPLATQSLR